MKLFRKNRKELRIEFCESCATACSVTCIAEGERDRIFENLLRYGYRPL